ncbi:gastrula zinc finger protein XlCGF8.2DB-like [Anabrus simplex]|uniref:gastrula zinc finger protein XlCGF8.2DB-like n=1 Tax=Anabrus simplex TaxID=316456 RepID=UPI0035A2FFD6
MEEPVFVKCEPWWSLNTEDEPPNLEHSQPVSEMIPLKQETKLELMEPGPTQANSFEPCKDIKEEIFIEQHQPVPNTKEESNAQNAEVLTVYTDEGLHYCTVCNMMSSKNCTLRKHLSSHCIEALFSCNECNTTYTQSSELATHMLTHSEATPYHCMKCNSKFAKRSYLRNHMSSHSEVRPYRCTECNKSFIRRFHLRTHMVVHSKGLELAQYVFGMFLM